MRDLPSSAQSAIEYGVVVILIVIIIAGSYKLYKNWTSPEPVKTHQSSTANIGQKIMEKPGPRPQP